MARNRVATPREEKVEELLDVAEELFERSGFAGTSTSQLAKACGVSERTLFWYFPSKDHLLVAVARRGVSRLAARLGRKGWPSGDFADDLFRMLKALRAIRHLLPVMHQRAEVTPFVAAARAEVRAANHRFIGERLRALGVREDELDDAVVVVVSFADGVLLRNIGDARLRRLCEFLVARLVGPGPAAKVRRP